MLITHYKPLNVKKKEKKRKCAKYHTLEGKWERNAIPNKLPIYIIHNNA